MTPSISQFQPLLQSLAEGRSPTADEWDALKHWTLTDTRRAHAFGITPETVDDRVHARLDLLQRMYPEFVQFCGDRLQWSEETVPQYLPTVWTLWLPLALQFAALRRELGRSLIQGILGGQGTGKTTLAAILSFILSHLGHPVCSLSIDDLYKPYKERQQLQAIDPRLRWRGPPGTHDVELGMQVLQKMRHGDATTRIAVPRFDKSLWGGAGDRTEAEWITTPDIVLFEGWFVGVRPIDPRCFDHPPDPIVTEGDRQFARDMNAALATYVPLWEQMDRLMVLCPVDYRLSLEWRKQAEQQMKATGRSGMGNAEIEEFVNYFWRSLHPELFITPLIHQSGYADLVVEIQADHTPGAVYRPGE
jgi:D-glycerate 3-kinase